MNTNVMHRIGQYNWSFEWREITADIIRYFGMLTKRPLMLEFTRKSVQS